MIDLGPSFVALDIATGAVRWHAVPWPDRRFIASNRIVARGGRVFVVDDVLNRAAALDTTDGHTLWSVSLNTLRLAFRVAVDDRALYVGTRAREVVALDVASGAEWWRRSLATSTWTSAGLSGVASVGEGIFVSGFRSHSDCPFCSDLMTAALASVSGDLIWQNFEGDSASDASAAPTVVDDVVLTSGMVHGLVARDRTTGRRRWRHEGAQGFVAMLSPPLVLGDTVIVGDGTTLYGVSLATGIPQFQIQRPSSIRYVAACAGRILTSRQALDIIDPGTQRVLGSWLNDDASRDGFITSGFGVSGNMAVVTGTKQVFGIRCR